MRNLTKPLFLIGIIGLIIIGHLGIVGEIYAIKNPTFDNIIKAIALLCTTTLSLCAINELILLSKKK